MGSFESFYKKQESYFESKNSAFTSLEIARQPDIWRKLISLLETRKDEIASFIKRIGDIKRLRIIIAGAGSSAYIGETASSIIGKTAKVHCEAVATTDIVSSPYSVLFADKPTLLVSIARSGNSPESVGAVRYARAIINDLWELAIVCDGNSALAKTAAESSKSLTLVMPEGSNDKGFAMTSSVTCMILTCFAFFNYERLSEIKNDIAMLADLVERAGNRLVETSRFWAETNYDRLVVIGSGCCRGIAREAALKSMELSAGFVNASGESSMGFRHGPKAVIKDNTLTIHIISPDSLTAKYDIDLLKEISSQKKGNRIIALSASTLPIKADENVVITAANKGSGAEIYFGICALVFCQLLAMFKSISLGLPTDNPVPSGELTRVVSGVTLYELERQAP